MASAPRVVARRRTQATNSIRSSSRKRSKSKSADEFEYDDTRCEECGSGDFGSELLLCDQCDRGFHLFCLRPILASVPSGSWYCPSCFANRKTIARFPLVQTKIVDFFRIQRTSQSSEKVCQDARKKRRRTSSLATSKKKRRLLPYSPSEDAARRLEQMASLATALTATGAEFSNELTYIHGMAPKLANCPAYEKGGMQVLSREDNEALNLCKSMMGKGECPPLMVVFDPVEGFTVEADKFIKDLTIITEYVGDVDYLERRENDDGDSIMTLLCAADSSKSLVICPDKRSNIARFINGINNHTPEGKKKQNLKCVRFDVDGEARVLLIANRDISKGERLYYDYNAYEHEYPTHHFV
ncbi:histone-lysine N-methyltransferase ATXR6 [Cynara cardunculus var. scolymus]|uniref:histone-lysine N-methyltransferase ATXR6 n=1 Tax=Cynara cardunculus var. scolymus TaxID=59895 RepID=UPI000D62985F|nr:histone-lysine N-methyltransferase ATXR6 [Cynara cardunculus var. scolymus]